jgi:predicted dehydrogenase
MEKIKCGIVGMGYVSANQIDGIRRLGYVEIAGAVDVDYNLARKKADKYYIPKCYRSIDEMLQDDEIRVIHNCTPNYLHKEINEKVIKAGRHIFSEKPLCKTSSESEELLKLLRANPGIVAGVDFVYRMNPLVLEMRDRVRKGEIGRPKLIHGSYLQDWLLYDTDYNWRMDSKVSGKSRCIADIGAHWMDLVQFITDSRIVKVSADLVTTIPVRKKPLGQVEAFSKNTSTQYEDKAVDTEDYGAVLFEMDNGVHGVFCSSEVSAGRKCAISFEIDGEKSSLYWNQEGADQMWMGFRDRPNQQIIRDPNSAPEDIREYYSLPAGHPEGHNDAMANIMRSFYGFIRDNKQIGRDACEFATFEEGHYMMKLIEAILESSQTKQWVSVI